VNSPRWRRARATANLRGMQPRILLNTARVEAWLGGLLRAHGNHDARLLAKADHVFRRKRDGRYLAVERGGELVPLRPEFRREAGLDAAVAALGRRHLQRRRSGLDAVPTLPLDRLHERLDQDRKSTRLNSSHVKISYAV